MGRALAVHTALQMVCAVASSFVVTPGSSCANASLLANVDSAPSYSTFSFTANSTAASPGSGNTYWLQLIDIRDALLEVRACGNDTAILVGPTCSNLTKAASIGECNTTVQGITSIECQQNEGLSCVAFNPTSISGGNIYIIVEAGASVGNSSIAAAYLDETPAPPGGPLVRSVAELQIALTPPLVLDPWNDVPPPCNASSEHIEIHLPAGTRLELTQGFSIKCLTLSMTSNDEGATIDLMDSFMPMNLISLENKARLHLHNIHFTRGNFVSGLLNVSAGAFLSLTSCSFSQMQYEDVGCVEMGYMAQVVIERTRVSGCHSTSSSSLGAFIHGLATASLSLLAVNVSNCSATAGSTLHILGASTVQLEDCHFSLCTGNRGGIMYGSGASFDMRNCVFRQSEALFGGVMHLWACNLRAYNCTFADAHSKSGGLLSLVGSPFDSVPVISIISSFFSAGTADHDGGAIRSSGAIDFFLLDSTFDHCSSREAGGAIYVANSDIHCSGCLFFNITSEGRGGVLSLRDGLLVSTVRNCLAQGAAAQTAGGSVTLSRDAKLIVTNSSLSNATAWFGGLISVHSSSSLELYHVLLAHGEGIEGSAIYLTEIAHFSGVFVSIVHACHTNTSTIFQQGSSLGHVIFLRAVTFTSDCSLDQVYLNGECRFPRCNDDQFSGYTLSPCGSGATCTDESVSGIPEFTSPICQCAEPSYASSLAADPTLAPYREGCVSPPRSESVNSLKSDLQESIHKNVLGSPYKLSQLGFRMVGTDLRPETMPFWNSTVIMNEHNSRSWVALVPSSGVLSVAEFQDFRVSVVLNSSALPEQTSPYEAVLCLFVASPVARQYDKIFNVAVRLYVSASVVHSTSTWGRADNDTHLCHAVVFAPVESTKLKIGPASLPIPASPLFFQSCDVDSLPVQREIPRPDDSRSFEVHVRPCLTVSNTSSPCAGGMNFSDNGDSYCADGFHGPLCETCTAAGTYFSRGECAICASLSTSIGIAVGSGLAVVLMALVIALQAGYSRGVVEKWTRQLKRQPTAGKMINFTTGTLECRRSGSRQGRGRTLHLRPWRSKSRSVLSFLQQVGFLAKFKVGTDMCPCMLSTLLLLA
ncbi:hypothetical protein AB1Y20_008794 [Prymnesium parvum]|uniref:Right handed beta helix domain-containing protein n=1 Tax=Prymnesium parvum TaxID=97485 RepID=A0AB34IUE6_PRYPA